MRRSVTRPVLAAALAVLIIWPSGTRAAVQWKKAPLARVRTIQRGLGIRPPSTRTHRGKVRDPLYTRYALRTGKRERATVAFFDGSVLYVNQRTDAQLADPRMTVVRSGEVDLADQPGTRHTVRAAGAVATANGTNFDVRVKGKRATFIVVSGSVTVANRAGSVTATADQETTVSGTSPPTAPQPIDAAAAIGWTGDLAAGGWQQLKTTFTLSGPTGIGLDAAGNIYVANSSGLIDKISPAGKLLLSFGQKGRDPGQMQAPHDVAVDAQGNMYVTDYVSELVDKFSPTGTFLTSAGTLEVPDNKPGDFWAPTAITVDTTGNVYVVEQGNGRVQKLSPDLQPLSIVADSLSGPQGVAVDGRGTVYVAETAANRITAHGPDGATLFSTGTTGSRPGQLDGPLGLALDAHGNIYVAEVFNNRVSMFSATGEFVTAWGAKDRQSKPFFEPQDVAVAPDGTIYEVEFNTLWKLPAP